MNAKLAGGQREALDLHIDEELHGDADDGASRSASWCVSLLRSVNRCHSDG
jgi:hypothetical protein